MTQHKTTARYQLRTWDSELHDWTTQQGLSVPGDGMTWRELLRAFRELRKVGYDCRRDDPCLLVQRVGKLESQRNLFT